jgi:hypothetical protein
MNMLPPYQVCISFFWGKHIWIPAVPKYLDSEKAALYPVASAKTETAEKSQQTKASRRGPVENQTNRLASKKCQDF